MDRATVRDQSTFSMLPLRPVERDVKGDPGAYMRVHQPIRPHRATETRSRAPIVLCGWEIHDRRIPLGIMIVVLTTGIVGGLIGWFGKADPPCTSSPLPLPGGEEGIVPVGGEQEMVPSASSSKTNGWYGVEWGECTVHELVPGTSTLSMTFVSHRQLIFMEPPAAKIRTCVANGCSSMIVTSPSEHIISNIPPILQHFSMPGYASAH